MGDFKGALPPTKQQLDDNGGPTSAAFTAASPAKADVYWQQQIGQYVARAQMMTQVDFAEAQNTVIWGCPEWDGRRSTSSSGSVNGVSIYDNGYGMNALLGTTVDYPAPGQNWSHSKAAMRSRGNNIIGQYYRMGSVPNAAERVLVADGHLWVLYSRTINSGGIDKHPGGYVSPNVGVDPGGVYALWTAIQGITDFDFYRHSSKRPTGQHQVNGFNFWDKEGTVACNAGFLDGHAETITSLDQAYRAVFMKGPTP
jgi:prepilin-type processing-associated H-X9-DG protein